MANEIDNSNGKIIIYQSEDGKIRVCRKFRHATQHGAIEGKSLNQEVTLYKLLLHR